MASPPSPGRFDDVTEAPGVPLTPEAAAMIATRYTVGASLAAGRRVLELGCGVGAGLGLLARAARSVVGADYSAAMLRRARAQYGERVDLVRLSAERLPFDDAAFDLVLCYEASYYIPQFHLAMREIARVLGPDGTVQFVNANPERPDFIRSPHSVHYHTSDEFREALSALGFSVEVEGAFPIGASESAIVGLRRALSALGLVPRTLKGRAYLKRLWYRGMRALPAELPEGFATPVPRTPLAAGPVRDFKVLYVTGRRRPA